MPSGTHVKELDISIDKTWEFVSDMNKWAPLVPGYIAHEIISEKKSTWTFKGDMGMMQKIVTLQIDITEWKEPALVTFDLKGLNENFEGSGYFEGISLSTTTTKMTGHLDILAKGMMGPMINQILKSFVPKMATALMEAIAHNIMEPETVLK